MSRRRIFRRPVVPESLEHGVGKSLVIRNQPKLDALWQTEGKWQPLLDKSRLIDKVERQIGILREFYRISMNSGVDIFSILVHRWQQRVNQGLANQAYSEFVSKLQSGAIKFKEAKRRERRTAAGQRKQVQSITEKQLDQKRMAALSVFNALAIPSPEYSRLRGKLHEAIRAGKENEFLAGLEKTYGRKS